MRTTDFIQQPSLAPITAAYSSIRITRNDNSKMLKSRDNKLMTTNV